MWRFRFSIYDLFKRYEIDIPDSDILLFEPYLPVVLFLTETKQSIQVIQEISFEKKKITELLINI